MTESGFPPDLDRAYKLFKLLRQIEQDGETPATKSQVTKLCLDFSVWELAIIEHIAKMESTHHANS